MVTGKPLPTECKEKKSGEDTFYNLRIQERCTFSSFGKSEIFKRHQKGGTFRKVKTASLKMNEFPS